MRMRKGVGAMTTDNRTNELGKIRQNDAKHFAWSEAQVEAAAKAIADCHNPGMFEKYPENWRVEARAALEAATRVPVQGEPNDDMEARKIAEKLFPLDGSEPATVFEARRRTVEAIRLSRATVPDAATAAIERVRAIIKPHIGWQLRRAAKFGRTKPDCGCEQCQIHAALDGAPEPEWEYGEIGPANQVHMTTPERVRKSEALGWSQEIVRRYTAGPWVSVKVGDIGE